MQRADNDVAHDLCALTQWGADVRAQVGHTEELATLILANENVVASAEVQAVLDGVPPTGLQLLR